MQPTMKFYSLSKFIDTRPLPEIIAGCDEAGRGPWAGPVVAAAVIFPSRIKLPGVNDSKKLSEAKREELFELITKKCIYGIGIISHKTIDEEGLSRATYLAHLTAVLQLKQRPDHIIIDGRDNFKFPIPHTSVVKGDGKLRVIAAASIIAKVSRDRIMKEMSKKYPEYKFELHKGYGTQLHQDMIKKHGISSIHRKSFRPISEATNK